MAEKLLAKYEGKLVLIEVGPVSDSGSGQCPSCGDTDFCEGDYDWTECCNSDCDFAVSTSGLARVQTELKTTRRRFLDLT